MSDAVIIALGTAFLSLLGVCFNAVMVYLIAGLNQKQAAAAVAVSEVKVNLAKSKISTDEKLSTIHSLVNSQLGVALKNNAMNARWRAESTGLPEDKQAADQAEDLLKQHERNQAEADKTKKVR